MPGRSPFAVRHGAGSAVVAAGIAAFAVLAGAGGWAPAHGAEPVLTAPLHGGVLNSTKGHVFETVLAADGIHVYLYTEAKAPELVEKAKGTAMLKLPGGKSLEVKLAPREPAEGERTAYFCPMHPEVVQMTPGECEPCNGMILYKQDRLFGAANLAGVKAEQVTAMVRLTGLSGRVKDATFTPAFRAPERKAGTSSGNPSTR